MLGLRFCSRAFSSCGKRGPLFIAVCGPLTMAASLVAEHRLQARRLSSCGSRVQMLRGMWDLPRPGLEPMSPALAGGFSTTAPPGKPHTSFLFHGILLSILLLSVQRVFKFKVCLLQTAYNWVSFFLKKIISGNLCLFSQNILVYLHEMQLLIQLYAYLPFYDLFSTYTIIVFWFWVFDVIAVVPLFLLSTSGSKR